MADLKLHGPLDLKGTLELVGDGGKVLVNDLEALIEQATGTAKAPVVLPPPPASPIDPTLPVTVVSSLGKIIKAGGKPVVTTGMLLQGASKTWPGMVLPSTKNAAPSQVTANGLPINVKGDLAMVFPNGGTAEIDQSSGQ